MDREVVRKMNKMRLRTKFEIIGALFFIVLLIAISVSSLTRTITDSMDTSYTCIRNSNGKYWEPTGANIQIAINDLGSSGGTVWLPEGTLSVTSTINLNNNVALIGGGVQATRISSNLAGDLLRAIGKQFVTIKGLTLDMNNKGSNSIYISSASKNVWIQEVALVNSGFQSIYVTDDSSYIFISNVLISRGVGEGSHGIAGKGMKNSVIENCIIENYDYHITEVGIDIASCENITLNNIIIRGKGWLNGIKTPGSKNIMMSNIMVYDSTSYGLKIQDCFGISIDNFYIEKAACGLSVFSTAQGIHLSNGHIKNSYSGNKGMEIAGQDICISNVEISDSGGIGFSINGDAKNIQITNLRVLRSRLYNKINTGASNIIISNSIFSYGSDMGLSIDGASNFKIVNCIFEGNVGDGIDTTTVACKDYIITHCTFKNNAKGIDCNVNDDRNIITLNDFINDTLNGYSKYKGLIENNIGIDI